MDDAVVVQLHAVVISSRTGLNKPDARALVKYPQSRTCSIFGLAEVRSIRALNTWGQHGVMQNENLNDFNRLQVISNGRL
jgi:hypothetical protein